MKKMTCKQLGGACDLEFRANTFEEMAELSKNHGMEMFKKGDEPHLQAMSNMQTQMKETGAMEKWFAERKKEFDALPDEK